MFSGFSNVFPAQAMRTQSFQTRIWVALCCGFAGSFKRTCDIDSGPKSVHCAMFRLFCARYSLSNIESVLAFGVDGCLGGRAFGCRQLYGSTLCIGTACRVIAQRHGANSAYQSSTPPPNCNRCRKRLGLSAFAHTASAASRCPARKYSFTVSARCR